MYDNFPSSVINIKSLSRAPHPIRLLTSSCFSARSVPSDIHKTVETPPAAYINPSSSWPEPYTLSHVLAPPRYPSLDSRTHNFVRAIVVTCSAEPGPLANRLAPQAPSVGRTRHGPAVASKRARWGRVTAAV